MDHSVQTFSEEGVTVQFSTREAARVSRCRHTFPDT